MTTPPCLLADRVGNGPIIIQRTDSSSYSESDPEIVRSLITLECVEGVGPRSGRIARLRMLFSEEETLRRLTSACQAKEPEVRGTITSQASRTVFRESLSDCLWTWRFIHSEV